jgi:cytochrome c oxidase assembly factor CtaG
MLDALPIILTVAAFVVHLVGLRMTEKRTAPKRIPALRRRAYTFYAGLFALLLAVATPLDTWSQKLLWTHMIQHVLLLAVAAPLIVAGAPWWLLFWRPLPLGFRRWMARAWASSGGWLAPVHALWRRLARPIGALIAYSIVVLGWHVPALYDATLKNINVHGLEHIMFLVAGIVLFLQVIPSPPFKPTLSYPKRIALMGGAMLVNIVLSMALAFSQSPLYPYYAHIVNRPGNISAMTDQQIAAGIMWSAGDLPFALVVAWLAYAWMAQIERDTDETGRGAEAVTS